MLEPHFPDAEFLSSEHPPFGLAACCDLRAYLFYIPSQAYLFEYLECEMVTDVQIQKVLNKLAEINPCNDCGTRLRFGDWECPHCGVDLEEHLRLWARQVVVELQLET